MTYSLFSYKEGSSFLHRMPVWCKIIFIPLVNILFLCLPPVFSVLLFILQIIIAFCLHFSVKEQLCDLRPVLYYALLLLIFQLFSFLFNNPSLENFLIQFSLESEKETLLFIIKLLAIMQTASLIFKTSTSLELREGIGKIFGTRSVITNALSMFLTFIPLVSRIWYESKRAWLARGGKHNLKMYRVLLPILFSVGMKKAWNLARAVSIRIM